MASKRTAVKPTQPPHAEAERCIALRKRSKQGMQNTPEDSAFCASMYRTYPKWYADTEERVFNETVPFGSQATYRSRT